MSEELIERAPQGLGAPGGYNIGGVLGRYQFIREIIEQVMQEGVHYGGSFPGDEKKNLLKPGADALGVAFLFNTEFTVDERNYDNGHREYRVTCHVKTAQGVTVAQGVGTCSTLESKYRWRQGKRLCPACGKEAIIRGKPEYAPKDRETGEKVPGYEKGGWLCFKKKDGCGANFRDADPAIVDQSVAREENNPADNWNTCLKVGKKRACVDGMITATGASSLFTQDAEELEHGDGAPAPRASAPAASAPPKAAAPPKASAPAPAPKPDPVQFGSLLHNAKTLTELEDVWLKVILPVQGQLPGASMAALMKIKREVEKALRVDKLIEEA